MEGVACYFAIDFNEIRSDLTPKILSKMTLKKPVANPRPDQTSKGKSRSKRWENRKNQIAQHANYKSPL